MRKLSLISIAIVLVVSIPISAYTKTYRWRLQAFYPPPEVKYVVSLAEFVKHVEKQTDGQIKISLFSAGALVPSPEIFKSVADGIVEMGVTVPGYHVGIMPFCAVPDGLPLSWQNPEQIREAMLDKGLADLMREEYAKHGVYFLTWQGGGPMTIITSRELRSRSDFKGTKVRSWGGWNKYFSMLGFSPVDAPLKDIYMGLSMNVFDSAFTGLAAHYSMKHYEVAKFGMKPFIIGDAIHDITVNLKAWNSLPDDLKQKLTQAAADFNEWNRTYFYQNYELIHEKKLEEAGLKWVNVDDDAWAFMEEKAEEFWTDIAAKDAASEKAVRIMKNVLKK